MLGVCWNCLWVGLGVLLELPMGRAGCSVGTIGLSVVLGLGS